MTATLLAIDDSKTMRKVLEITFAGEDYRTVLSESASDALAKLRSERPAVVLLDAILGDVNGYDLCQRIWHLAGKHLLKADPCFWGQTRRLLATAKKCL